MSTTPALEIEQLETQPSQPELVVNEAFALFDAILGQQLVIELVLDADYAITAAGAYPQQWQYSAIKITDSPATLTTTRNIIWPAKNKRGLFSFKNATAQTLVVKRAGQTGIPVAAGAEALLRDSGTDIVEAFTGSSGTVGPNSITNSLLADMAANTIKARATSTTGDPQDVAFAANTFPARGSTGDLAAKAITDSGLLLVALTLAANTFPARSSAGALAATTISDNGISLVGAVNYAAMRTLLGLVIGTDVQAYDSDLAAIAALSTTSFGRSLLTPADALAARVLLSAAARQSTLQTQTASYTLVAADGIDSIVEINAASANSLTVPPNSSVPFAIGTTIALVQLGAGQTTVAAGAGVTIRSSGGRLKLTGQYSGGTLYKRATDEWLLTGDITT